MDINNTMLDKQKADSIDELFGTLQEAVTGTWRQHLKTSKHNVHVILNDFYNDFPDVVDTLIENYMGIFGKVESYINVLSIPECPIEYLEKLRNFCENSKYLLNNKSELESDMDSILSFIDSTLYKLKELTGTNESRHLSDFVKNAIQ